ncbi:MAG: exodeoxyribonuclease III [Kofleriaceae bacterium]
MKLATWNVNSIRARHDRLLAWLRAQAPDVVCLQETKVEDAAFPVDALAELGYHAAIWGQRTYNGVAILARTPPADVERGLGDGDDDDQARLIAATVDGIRVVCAYVPNGGSVGSDKYAYKLRWLERLRAYLEARARPDQAWILCGDMNVAPDDRDVHDPAAWEGQLLCTPAERAGLQAALAWGMSDVFRHHHAEGGHYSWWDYRGLAFFKDQGARIDHVFATPPVVERSRGCVIDRAARKGTLPSDHAPVIVELG